MKELLIKLQACQEALVWAGDKTWEEIYNTCERGDWLLWLHDKTNKEDLQVRTLAKGHCANTVRHLMQDERSLKAIDTAIAFGDGRATLQELDAAYSAAADAVEDAYYPRAAAAAYTANAADYAAEAAYYAAAYSVARTKNQKETADIVRKYIPIELWNVNKMIDEVNVEKEVRNEK